MKKNLYTYLFLHFFSYKMQKYYFFCFFEGKMPLERNIIK